MQYPWRIVWKNVIFSKVATLLKTEVLGIFQKLRLLFRKIYFKEHMKVAAQLSLLLKHSFLLILSLSTKFWPPPFHKKILVRPCVDMWFIPNRVSFWIVHKILQKFMWSRSAKFHQFYYQTRIPQSLLTVHIILSYSKTVAEPLFQNLYFV